MLLQGQSTAARKLTDSQWKLQRHVRITAAVLPDAEAAGFHTVSASFPKIPNLEASRPVPCGIVCVVSHP